MASQEEPFLTGRSVGFYGVLPVEGEENASEIQNSTPQAVPDPQAQAPRRRPSRQVPDSSWPVHEQVFGFHVRPGSTWELVCDESGEILRYLCFIVSLTNAYAMATARSRAVVFPRVLYHALRGARSIMGLSPSTPPLEVLRRFQDEEGASVDFILGAWRSLRAPVPLVLAIFGEAGLQFTPQGVAYADGFPEVAPAGTCPQLIAWTPSHFEHYTPGGQNYALFVDMIFDFVERETNPNSPLQVVVEAGRRRLALSRDFARDSLEPLAGTYPGPPAPEVPVEQSCATAASTSELRRTARSAASGPPPPRRANSNGKTKKRKKTPAELACPRQGCNATFGSRVADCQSHFDHFHSGEVMTADEARATNFFHYCETCHQLRTPHRGHRCRAGGPPQADPPIRQPLRLVEIAHHLLSCDETEICAPTAHIPQRVSDSVLSRFAFLLRAVDSARTARTGNDHDSAEFRRGADRLIMRLPALIFAPTARGRPREADMHRRLTLLSSSDWHVVFGEVRDDREPGDSTGPVSTADASVSTMAALRTTVDATHRLVGKGQFSRAMRRACGKAAAVQPTPQVVSRVFPVRDDDTPGSGGSNATTSSGSGGENDAATPPPASSVPDSQRLLIDKVEHMSVVSLRHALRQCKPLAAKGATGWSTDLMVLLFEHAGDTMLSIIKRFILGDFESSLYPFLQGGNLALLDKGEGRDPRPIVCDCAWAKVAGRLLMPPRADITKHFAPYQFGVGQPRGAALAVHIIDSVLSKSPSLHLASLDLTNAYNSVRRTAIHDALMANDNFRYLAPYFERAYSRPLQVSHYAGDGSLAYAPMSTGVIQGSSLSPFFFALALHAPLLAMMEACNGDD